MVNVVLASMLYLEGMVGEIPGLVPLSLTSYVRV